MELPELDVSGPALGGVLLMIVRTMNVSETCAGGNSTQAPPLKVKGPLYWNPRGNPGEEEKLESLLRNAFVAPVTAFFRQGAHAAPRVSAFGHTRTLRLLNSVSALESPQKWLA